MNRDIMQFNDKLDKDVLKPLAKGYQWITPEFMDVGITNFFSNLILTQTLNHHITTHHLYPQDLAAVQPHH
jgi:ABC-type transporter lipoprotein component MlaA